MTSTADHPPRHHLFALGIAVGVALLCATGTVVWCAAAEKRFVHSFAEDLDALKLHGVALQKAAFAQPDLLVLYGSSELVTPVPNKAAEFFEEYPTGFRAFPVGKPGTTSLAIMQKVASLGRHVVGRKAAFSLSPGFFLMEKVNEDYYEGNFSPLQSAELAFSRHLSRELKRDAARRIIQYPQTLEAHWTLDFAMRRLAGDTMLDRALYAAVWPLGRLTNAVGRAQDHIEAGLKIAEMNETADPKPGRIRGLNWKEVLRRTSVKAKNTRPAVSPRLIKRPRGSMDAAFLRALKTGDEWEDFELLLRVLWEMRAETLLISMPLHGADLETTGVSAEARRAYGERLGQLAATYGAQLIYFGKYENDATFFVDNLDHPGERGWMLVNKALDDFFHDRHKTRK